VCLFLKCGLVCVFISYRWFSVCVYLVKVVYCVCLSRSGGNVHNEQLRDEPMGGGLKRSHSSPNVHALVNGEKVSQTSSRPEYDRVGKPA